MSAGSPGHASECRRFQVSALALRGPATTHRVLHETTSQGLDSPGNDRVSRRTILVSQQSRLDVTTDATSRLVKSSSRFRHLGSNAAFLRPSENAKNGPQFHKFISWTSQRQFVRRASRLTSARTSSASASGSRSQPSRCSRTAERPRRCSTSLAWSMYSTSTPPLCG